MDVPPYAEEVEVQTALVAPVQPVQPAPIAFGSLTPEQLAKHQAYRAKKKLKCSKHQNAKADEGVALTRTPSPPVSPPSGPAVQKKPIKKKSASKQPVLSTQDKKLLLNRAANYKQNKLLKLKAEAVLLEQALAAKEQQQKLLLAVLASAKKHSVAKSVYHPAVAHFTDTVQ